MAQSPASEHIRAARTAVKLASQICGTADLARLQGALNLLETGAAEMRLAEAAVQSGGNDDASGMAREAGKLKREVACMMRTVDGCAALHRGMAVRLGCRSITYTPQGRAAIEPAFAAAYKMQA